MLREVGRGERAEERGQNLLESGSDVGVGGQRGEHRTEREHADCEDYSSRDSRGRDSDSRDDFTLFGVCAHARILHGVESAGQLEVRDVAGDEERESLYEIVEDEQEQEGLLAVFEQLLDDVDIER